MTNSEAINPEVLQNTIYTQDDNRTTITNGYIKRIVKIIILIILAIIAIYIIPKRSDELRIEERQLRLEEQIRIDDERCREDLKEDKRRRDEITQKLHD
ncbi:hypothetical protein NEPAR04_1749 [Nematocida parisii]|nr:hypothetical protein NEPAR04_1749 [Nematocida parisii]